MAGSLGFWGNLSILAGFTGVVENLNEVSFDCCGS